MIIPAFASWLASTVLPLGVLWLLFSVLLRQEPCFTYNRVLLLLAPVAAGVLPLLPRPALGSWLAGASLATWPTAAGPPVLLPTLQASASQPSTWPGWYWLAGIYLLGVALGLGRLVYQVGHLRRLARRLPREPRPGYVLVRTGGQLPTSSFGHKVFWNDAAELTAAEAATVLAHELAHVRQGHTYDIVWLEFWRAVLWPNPFAHLLLPALRLTHELLADREAMQASAEPLAAYAALLARLTASRLVGGSHLTMLQPFTFSFTLARIAMLQSQIPVRRWKQWLALPLVAGLGVVLGQSADAQTTPPAPPPPPKLLTTAQATAAASDKVYTFVEQMPHLPGGGGQAAIVQAIQSKLVYPKGVGAVTKGIVFAYFIVQANGAVTNPRIIKGLTDECDKAVLAAVQQLPRFEPGKQNGRVVAVSFTVPIKFEP